VRSRGPGVPGCQHGRQIPAQPDCETPTSPGRSLGSGGTRAGSRAGGSQLLPMRGGGHPKAAGCRRGAIEGRPQPSWLPFGAPRGHVEAAGCPPDAPRPAPKPSWLRFSAPRWVAQGSQLLLRCHRGAGRSSQLLYPAPPGHAESAGCHRDADDAVHDPEKQAGPLRARCSELLGLDGAFDSQRLLGRLEPEPCSSQDPQITSVVVPSGLALAVVTEPALLHQRPRRF
jgi:hypothetical protein